MTGLKAISNFKLIIHIPIFFPRKSKLTTTVSFDRGLDKDVVYIYNGALLSNEKTWNTDICNNMDESWEYHDKQNTTISDSCIVRQKQLRTIWIHLYVEIKVKTHRHRQ